MSFTAFSTLQRRLLVISNVTIEKKFNSVSKIIVPMPRHVPNSGHFFSFWSSDTNI